MNKGETGHHLLSGEWQDALKFVKEKLNISYSPSAIFLPLVPVEFLLATMLRRGLRPPLRAKLKNRSPLL